MAWCTHYCSMVAAKRNNKKGTKWTSHLLAGVHTPEMIKFCMLPNFWHNHCSFFPYIKMYYCFMCSKHKGQIILSFTGHIRIVSSQSWNNFILPFWHLEFAHGLHILGKFVCPCCVSRAPLVIRYEVLIAVWLKIQIFWDVILSCWVSGSQHLTGTVILSNTRTHSSSNMSHPEHHVSWYNNRRNTIYVFM